MSKPNWTPGPWHFKEPWSGFSAIHGPNNELIFGIAAGTPEEKQPDEICTANARLIAAAPDLYESLEWAMKNLRSGLNEWCGDHSYHCAKRVLKNAKGESAR